MDRTRWVTGGLASLAALPLLDDGITSPVSRRLGRRATGPATRPRGVLWRGSKPSRRRHRFQLALRPACAMTDLHEERNGPETRLILGLGNPGMEYRASRHNLGFRVVDELADRRGLRLDRLECNALLGEDSEVLLAAPQTYMNRSGFAARCLSDRRGVVPERILVVYDDVQLDLGQLRMRRKGGPGGHRGMESVIRNLRTEHVPRLRLGVADPEAAIDGANLEEYVLAPFQPEELELVEQLVSRAADASECWLREGVEATMNRFND